MKEKIAACIFINFAILILLVNQAAGQNSVEDPGTVLDAVAQVVELKGTSGEGVVHGSPEYKMANTQGVTILPELARRLAVADSPMLIRVHMMLFYEITHFTPFPFASKSFVEDGVDYFEADSSSLPFLKRQLDGGGQGFIEERDALLTWWKKMQQSNQLQERTTNMCKLVGHLDADAADMTGNDYHGFVRANINYGIFNLPVYIALIKKNNNPLAFMEFLCVSSHPAYRNLNLPANAVERLKRIKKEWPSKVDRVSLVEKWWAENAAKYESTLPSLAQAIAQAFKD